MPATAADKLDRAWIGCGLEGCTNKNNQHTITIVANEGDRKPSLQDLPPWALSKFKGNPSEIMGQRSQLQRLHNSLNKQVNRANLIQDKSADDLNHLQVWKEAAKRNTQGKKVGKHSGEPGKRQNVRSKPKAKPVPAAVDTTCSSEPPQRPEDDTLDDNHVSLISGPSFESRPPSTPREQTFYGADGEGASRQQPQEQQQARRPPLNDAFSQRPKKRARKVPVKAAAPVLEKGADGEDAALDRLESKGALDNAPSRQPQEQQQARGFSEDAGPSKPPGQRVKKVRAKAAAKTAQEFESAMCGGAASGARATAGMPIAVDASETADAYLFVADLPGVQQTDTKVQASRQDSLLTIRGERPAPSVTEDQQDMQRRTERRFGKFSRSFKLPRDAELSKITASFSDGVLTVTIARVQPTEPEVVNVPVDGWAGGSSQA